MSTISLGHYGDLHFRDDYWFCEAAPTAIGSVDFQVDAGDDLPVNFATRIMAAIDRIEHVNSEAQTYLRQHAPDDFARARPLREPSLLFRPDEPAGSFTIFYSGADEDDEMCYGVAFRDFAPFDLTIGD